MAIVAAVLAGGASTRMGTPKAAVALDGRTLLARAVEAARAAGLRPVVVAKAGSELGGDLAGAERWTEPDAPRHPLAGIVAALARAGAQGVVALPCDAPLLPPRLLRALAACEATTLVRGPDGRLHPLPGRYAASAAAPLAAALAAEAPLRRALADLGAAVLDEPDAGALLNVNTPGDLARAAALLRGDRGDGSPGPG